MSNMSVNQIPAFVPDFSDSSGNIGDISSLDFLQILITELLHQDPLDPMDNKALMEQVAMIRELESNTRISENFSNLLFSSNLAGASALIGREVTGMDASGNGVTGVVDSVLVEDRQVYLSTSNGYLPVENVLSVTQPVTEG